MSVEAETATAESVEHETEPVENTPTHAPLRWAKAARERWNTASTRTKIVSAAAVCAVAGAAVYVPTVTDNPAPSAVATAPADPFQTIMADAAAWIPPTLDTMPCDPEDMEGLYFFDAATCRIDLTYGGNGNVTPDAAAQQTGHSLEEARDAFYRLVAGTAAGLAQSKRTAGDELWDNARPYSRQLSAVCLAGAYMAHSGVDEGVGAAVLNWEFMPVPDDGTLRAAYLNMRLHASARGYLFEKNEGSGVALARCTHLLVNANFT